ncbi:hypothetical protein K466DRAFT_185264 [Polyporus arcularius HHB13444]|uniref:Uncharacterized protein n=1 Tax=Polyporus arcularius HHB13444 TaxID=1314778 RepID=A0A5C3P9E6_9APHY|nr:hypothetical protein K466DRAFT_185264 [Polyporus arcularius HHB13444]
MLWPSSLLCLYLFPRGIGAQPSSATLGSRSATPPGYPQLRPEHLRNSSPSPSHIRGSPRTHPQLSDEGHNSATRGYFSDST